MEANNVGYAIKASYLRNLVNPHQYLLEFEINLLQGLELLNKLNNFQNMSPT